MESRRFDSLTRSLSTRLSRRTALGLAGLAGVAAVTRTDNPSVVAQEATAAPTGDLAADGAALFVQTATGGTFLPNPDAGAASPAAGSGAVAGDYVLTLDGHTGQTIAFADRPSRNVAEVPTDGFLTGLGFPADNPPNAAIVSGDDVLLVELFSPTYDAESGTLTYGASILVGYVGEGLAPVASQQRDQELVAEFDAASLFIDDCPDRRVECLMKIGNFSECRVVSDHGIQGYCWSWSAFRCEPCGGGFDRTAEVCNQNYPECEGRCFTNSGYCDI